MDEMRFIAAYVSVMKCDVPAARSVYIHLDTLDRQDWLRELGRLGAFERRTFFIRRAPTTEDSGENLEPAPIRLSLPRLDAAY
ncbi:MAG: hypothetical protein AAB466_00230 [Verrucomicrobiota bacterium]